MAWHDIPYVLTCIQMHALLTFTVEPIIRKCSNHTTVDSYISINLEIKLFVIYYIDICEFSDYFRNKGIDSLDRNEVKTTPCCKYLAR